MSKSGQDKIASILMNRDKISKSEAMSRIKKCVDSLESGDITAINYYLGLEDDYIFDLM